jgi:hypothetical protein
MIPVYPIFFPALSSSCMHGDACRQHETRERLYIDRNAYPLKSLLLGKTSLKWS